MQKYKLIPLALLITSGALYAAEPAMPNCGSLGISFTNQSGETCILKHVSGSGIWTATEVPQKIENGETTPVFYIQQKSLSGPSLEVDYRCGRNLLAKFSSAQAY